MQADAAQVASSAQSKETCSFFVLDFLKEFHYAPPMSSPPPPHPRERHDGWTGVRRDRFIDLLSVGLSASRAAMLCGMARQTAYRLRARDPGFARAWDMAEARVAVSDARARITGRKSPLARLARLGKVALPGDDAAAISAGFDTYLARIGDGKGDKSSDSRNL